MILAVLTSLETALLPPIGGIAPLEAAHLVAMEVSIGGKGGSSSAVYRIASPLSPEVFGRPMPQRQDVRGTNRFERTHRHRQAADRRQFSLGLATTRDRHHRRPDGDAAIANRPLPRLLAA